MPSFSCFTPVFLGVKLSYCLIFQSFPQSWSVWRERRLRSMKFPERTECTSVRGQRMKTTTTSWVTVCSQSAPRSRDFLQLLSLCLSSVGRSHNHHVPRGTRRRVRGLFRTEQKKCGDHQLDSSTHEEVQEGKMSSSPLKRTHPQVCLCITAVLSGLLFIVDTLLHKDTYLQWHSVVCSMPDICILLSMTLWSFCKLWNKKQTNPHTAKWPWYSFISSLNDKHLASCF